MPEGREKTILMTDCVIGSTLIYKAYMQLVLKILQSKWHIWGVNQTSPPLPTLNIPWPLTERHFVWLGRLLLTSCSITYWFVPKVYAKKQTGEPEHRYVCPEIAVTFEKIHFFWASCC